VLFQTLTDDLRTGSIFDAICDVIQRSATSLETALPRAADDVNELPDTLVLLD
jgi:uncharacterized membrane protein